MSGRYLPHVISSVQNKSRRLHVWQHVLWEKTLYGGTVRKSICREKPVGIYGCFFLTEVLSMREVQDLGKLLPEPCIFY
jgi:hypothetical protein